MDWICDSGFNLPMPTSYRHRRNYNAPGHAHSLTFSCYRQFPFLRSELTCSWLAESIDAARTTQRFLLWAYVFMPEHVHAVVYPTESDYDIAEIRKAIKGPIGRRAIQHIEANSPEWLDQITRQRGGRTERLFWKSGGGYDRNITAPRTLLATIDYIHLNPVRRGLVERAEDWRWSSAASTLYGKERPLQVDPIPADWLE
ncbi:hypothetical protein Pla175_02630 [Pirellulimonas nuda]|uniref:Transposase IS200-like domain-containing protein n=1 Tax=Pirellulimonas nuda TaxID=2528009 RepID=A0A518D622_9BACT|nr:transposase [Pirellulimonas nuda]QDU86909.1 hypothetical protein Pla175_02630 [Pirellulimonas nuda]